MGICYQYAMECKISRLGEHETKYNNEVTHQKNEYCYFPIKYMLMGVVSRSVLYRNLDGIFYRAGE